MCMYIYIYIYTYLLKLGRSRSGSEGGLGSGSAAAAEAPPTAPPKAVARGQADCTLRVSSIRFDKMLLCQCILMSP